MMNDQGLEQLRKNVPVACYLWYVEGWWVCGYRYVVYLYDRSSVACNLDPTAVARSKTDGGTIDSSMCRTVLSPKSMRDAVFSLISAAAGVVKRVMRKNSRLMWCTNNDYELLIKATKNED